MQIGRTLVVFKVKPSLSKKYKVGQFLDQQADKDIKWKKEFIKNYQKLEADLKKPREGDKKKKIKMDSFDFRQYMQHLEKESSIEAIIKRQYQDHDIHMISQNNHIIDKIEPIGHLKKLKNDSDDN